MKDEPIDWEESIDPSESLTIDHEIDIKPVRNIKLSLLSIVYETDNARMNDFIVLSRSWLPF